MTETIHIEAQSGPQTKFLENPADIVIYGGAAGGGKSYGLLLDAGGYVHIPKFNAVIFRKSYPQIANAGGLWDESCEIYPYMQGVPTRSRLLWEFPSSATVTMRHMQNESTKYDYQGAEIPYIGWDELTHFSESQFWYMMSRNRSMSGVRGCIRATCNPDADSWVADFISWWIAEDGYANVKRIGIVRWMIRDRNSIIWFDSQKEAKQKFPNIDSRSVTFIPSSVYDNKKLLEKDPSYLANLQSLPEVERLRLLGDPKRGGNWHVKAGGTTFKREHFKIIDEAPHDIMRLVRFWDLAATEPKKGKNPDWTAGVKLGFKDGGWYVLDVRRDRKSPKGTEDLVLHTAIEDGREVPVRMEEEGGSSGKNNTDHYARNVLVGFDYAGIRSTGDKSIRANPVASASENGNVYLVKAPWNKSFLDELESFSAECEHDDQCFPAGTLIDTPDGQKPIEDFAIGDYVLTPSGNRMVYNCGITNLKDELITITTLSAQLSGTLKHPVFTDKDMYVYLDALSESDIIYVKKEIISWNEKQSCMQEKNGIDTQNQNVERTGFISNIIAHGSKHRNFYIDAFMKIISEKSQKVIAYIIKTTILPIINYLILKLCGTENTGNFILSKTEKKCWHILNQLDRLHLNGIVHQKVSHGIDNTVKMYGVKPEKIITIRKEKFPKSIPVYNLSVEQDHCYFANGILVHNCDAVSGAFNYLSLKFISPSLTGMTSENPLAKQIEHIDENIQRILGGIKSKDGKIKAYELLKKNGLI